MTADFIFTVLSLAVLCEHFLMSRYYHLGNRLFDYEPNLIGHALPTVNSSNFVSNFYYILSLTLLAKVKLEYSLLE